MGYITCVVRERDRVPRVSPGLGSGLGGPGPLTSGLGPGPGTSTSKKRFWVTGTGLGCQKCFQGLGQSRQVLYIKFHKVDYITPDLTLGIHELNLKKRYCFGIFRWWMWYSHVTGIRAMYSCPHNKNRFCKYKRVHRDAKMSHPTIPVPTEGTAR